MGHEIFAGVMEVFAALALLIFAANFVHFLLNWRRLSAKGRFTATGKIIDVARHVKTPDQRTYTVEFFDAENIRREGTFKSEPWQKYPYEPGDEIKVLYDPLNPRDLVNYSAYELLK